MDLHNTEPKGIRIKKDQKAKISCGGKMLPESSIRHKLAQILNNKQQSFWCVCVCVLYWFGDLFRVYSMRPTMPTGIHSQHPTVTTGGWIFR